MSKNAQIRQQLNIRFTGEDKAELLTNLDAYLTKYTITKADFIAQCIQNGIDNDVASFSPKNQETEKNLQYLIDESITPLQQRIVDIEKRLGKSRGLG